MGESGHFHIGKMIRNAVLVILAVIAVFQIMRTTSGIRDRDLEAALTKINPHLTVYSLKGDTADIRTLGDGKPFVVVYFSPDCDHCQHEATLLKEHLGDFQGVGIVMLSLENLETTLAFSRDYHLAGEPGVRFYLDVRHQFPLSFKTRGYPIVLVYSDQGKLARVFQGETSVKEILGAVPGS